MNISKKLSVRIGKHRYEVLIRNSIVAKIEKSEAVSINSVGSAVRVAILDKMEDVGLCYKMDEHGNIRVWENKDE